MKILSAAGPGNDAEDESSTMQAMMRIRFMMLQDAGVAERQTHRP